MKAITYQGVRDVAVTEVADPKILKDDDIIVRITTTTICGSDLHLFRGRIPKMPEGFIIGHEAMGIVEETGKAVAKIKKGDRVVVPFPVACGHCFYCTHGQFSQCDNSNDHGEVGAFLGYSELMGGYDGAQAEYLRVPYANVGPRIIPENLTDEQVLFLSDILPTSYWGVDNGGVKPGDTVVVLGCGPVGLLTQKWAKYKGAERIIAVDNIDYRLHHAKKFNQVETINFNDYDNTGETIKEITHGGADVVIDCVGMDGVMSPIEELETLLMLQGGSKSAIEMASQAVRKCGTVSVVGVYGMRYNNFPFGDFFSRNITLKMGQCPAQSYMDEILALIQQNKFDATDIITHQMSLSEGKKAYELFDHRLDDCIKVILKP